MESIYQIYDRIFKRIFNLSNLAIVNLINGLFGTDYPLDSSVDYFNKEFINPNLNKRLADIFITICGVTYHLEAQMEEDETIVLRAFEYDFYYALEHQENVGVLYFPEPMIIYLDTGKKRPDKGKLTLNFGTQGSFDFEVTNFFYQEHEVEELNRRKMIALIPFQLLKLRKLINKRPTNENFTLLKIQIEDDIIGSIEENLRLGNITVEDAHQLRELVSQLYHHIYLHYEELGGEESMRPLLKGAMELPLDKYRIRIDELEEEKKQLEDRVEWEKNRAEQERAKAEQERTKAEQERVRAEEELRKLREEIDKLQKRE